MQYTHNDTKNTSGTLPTDPFTILKPQNLHTDEFYVVQVLIATDFKAPKFWNPPSPKPSAKRRWVWKAGQCRCRGDWGVRAGFGQGETKPVGWVG